MAAPSFDALCEAAAKRSKQRRAILSLLVVKYPGHVSRADLEMALWGNRPPVDNQMVQLRVTISILRRGLHKIGWTVSTGYGGEWRLQPLRVPSQAKEVA